MRLKVKCFRNLLKCEMWCAESLLKMDLASCDVKRGSESPAVNIKKSLICLISYDTTVVKLVLTGICFFFFFGGDKKMYTTCFTIVLFFLLCCNEAGLLIKTTMTQLLWGLFALCISWDLNFNKNNQHHNANWPKCFYFTHWIWSF